MGSGTKPGTLLPYIPITGRHSLLWPLPSRRVFISSSSGRYILRYDCFHIQCVKRKRHVHIRAAGARLSQDSESARAEFCLPIQTLETFPKERLQSKVVMVRIDARLCLCKDETRNKKAIDTLKYICNADAKVVIAYNMLVPEDSTISQIARELEGNLSASLGKKILVAEDVIGGKVEQSISNLNNGDVLLLGNLALHKDESSNLLDFARSLSFKVDILVNDSFSDSHRVLASTVGVARFASARIAGFHLADMLCLFKKIVEDSTRPFISIIGGAKIVEKRDALIFLLRMCDAVAFLGSMSFSLLYALGASIPEYLVDQNAMSVTMELLDIVKQENVKLLLPKDFWCVSEIDPSRELQLFSSHCISKDWRPIDIGPQTVDKISSYLSNSKKALWISPVKVSSSIHQPNGSLRLAALLGQSLKHDYSAYVLGRDACNFAGQVPVSTSIRLIHDHGAASWELLKGKELAGVVALDCIYHGNLNGNSFFRQPSQPLVVDIGSGNGLFLLRMSKRYQKVNFLGIEINKKLVDYSLSQSKELRLMNVYFIHADATTSFDPIVSSYSGALTMVTIQCPNPNFADPVHRWRMVQSSLVKSIVDKLSTGGKIFLHSDIKSVALQMKNMFLLYGKDKIVSGCGHIGCQQCGARGWLKNNPFGVYSDWEKHAIDQGKTMYRAVLSKVESYQGADKNSKHVEDCIKLLHNEEPLSNNSTINVRISDGICPPC